MGEQTEAARRAAARKAKILARGNTGLNKLAQTARGEEAEKLYGETSRPSTPAAKVDTEAEETAKPSWAPPPTAAGAGATRPPPSAEQQQMADQLNAMMSMFGGGPGGPGGAGGQPDMSQLLAQMMGGGVGAGGMPADRLLGDLDDPAGLSGTPPPPGFPDMSALGGMGGGMPGFPGMVPPRRSWVERIFPLVHALAMVLLVGFTVIWWEPRIGAGRAGHISRGWAERWGDLRGAKRFGDDFRISALVQTVEVLPMFWAFTTVELIIQTTRFILLKSPPPPHSLLQTFLPLMPPHLARPILTASRYFSLLSQTLKDGFLLVFLLGLVVILADYRS